MKWLLLIIILIKVSVLSAQIAIVSDAISGSPIEQVTLFSEVPQALVITNEKGEADISKFAESEKILIRHMSYKEAIYSYKQLEQLNFKISLYPKISQLQEVSVSAQRWITKKIETPNRISSINMREAAFQNPQTSADLLGVSGYAFIQKSQLGGGSPMLRGMATNRILIVVDGVRMNTAIFRSGNLQNVISLDANAMESTEILFGPGSVMFGSDAMGGVMNFGTLTPKLSSSQKKVEISGNAMTRYSSANNENTMHLDVNVGMRKLALLTSFTFADYDDLRSGNVGGHPSFYRTYYVIRVDNKDIMVPNKDSTLQVGSQYDQLNFMQKVKYQINTAANIEYAFHFSETSKYNRYDRLTVWRTDGPYKGKLRWAEWYYGPQKWQMHRIGLNSSSATKFYEKFKMVIAYQFFEESRYDREFMYRERRMQKENVHAFSGNIDAEKQWTEKLKIFYGYEFVHNTVYSKATLTHIIKNEVSPTVTRYPNGSIWMSNGVYITGTYKFHKLWLVNSGLRYNHFYIHADFDTTFFPFPFLQASINTGSTVGSVGLVYTPKPSWQCYTNLANGFRAPNIDDMGKVFESVPGYLVVPNPNLKPEKVYNFEAGIIKTVKNLLRIDATIYRTWLLDAMVRKNTIFNGDSTIRFMGNKSRVQSVQNVGEIDVYGFQAGLEFFYKGFGLRSHLSYQKGYEKVPDSSVTYPLRHAAPMFGSTHCTYEYKNKIKADFYVVYNAKMDYEDLALTERFNPSYARDKNGKPYVASWYTLNFKLGYYPSPSIAITGGIENIANVLYRPYASGINAPGRNFIFSLRVKF
ncbi:MAG: TonB-dependent receptor [Bacteroidales bacterium]|nr:TonB-dependent receptor [Bacteroidales bacterium]